MTQQFDLLNQPVPNLIRKIAVPTSIGYFFNTMFNVVDTYYGGRVSTEALAALSLSFPVFFLIIAVGAGISTGATALIGHALGAGEPKEARHLSVQTISFGLANGILVTWLGFLLAPRLFALLGGQGAVLTHAVGYIRAIFTGSVFFLVNFVLSAILNATGDTRSFRNFLVAGCILNLFLDPLLLYGVPGLPGLGFAGIGWGTVLIQGIGNLYLFGRVKKTGLLSGAGWRGLVPERRAYLELFKQGFPSSLNMLTVGIGIFVITWFVARFGKDAVAAYGIATRVEQIVLLPVMGLNVATLALVAQNSGAGNLERVVDTIGKALKAGVVLMLAGTAAVWLGAGPLMALFTKDGAVVGIGVSYLRIEAFVLVAYVILYTSVSALQGLKRPAFPLVIGLLRQIVLPLPVFYLLAVALDLGLYGIWWGILLVTWGAALVALYYMGRIVTHLTPAGAGEGKPADAGRFMR